MKHFIFVSSRAPLLPLHTLTSSAASINTWLGVQYEMLPGFMFTSCRIQVLCMQNVAYHYLECKLRRGSSSHTSTTDFSYTIGMHASIHSWLWAVKCFFEYWWRCLSANTCWLQQSANTHFILINHKLIPLR